MFPTFLRITQTAAKSRQSSRNILEASRGIRLENPLTLRGGGGGHDPQASKLQIKDVLETGTDNVARKVGCVPPAVHQDIFLW